MKQNKPRDNQNKKSFKPRQKQPKKTNFGSKDKKPKYFDESNSESSKKFDKHFDNNKKTEKLLKNLKKDFSKSSQNPQINDKQNTTQIRLNRFIAQSGICSRREADELIKNGSITVNDVVVKELGTTINPQKDVVRYKGKVLKGEKNVYILLNKPKDYITTAEDPEGRKTVLDLLKGQVKERVYPVGRLDRNTTGVLILTNDGELAQRLMHPSANVPKIYIATLDREVSKDDLKSLAEGFELDDGFINADFVSYFDNKQLDRVVLQIHSGRNHIVRRMFDHLGYKVKNLDRMEFAGITKRGLKRGQWRFLEEKEIGWLKMAAGKVNIENKS